MNTPDTFYFEGTAPAIPGVFLDFGFDAVTVDIFNDGSTDMRYNVRGQGISQTNGPNGCGDPKVKAGETFRILRPAGDNPRKGIQVAADSGTPSIRVVAHR